MHQRHNLSGLFPTRRRAAGMAATTVCCIWFCMSHWTCGISWAQASRSDYDATRVGDDVDGRIVVPTNQVLSPLGKQVAFSGRPTDVVLSPDGRWLAVLNRYEAILIDVESGEIVSRSKHRGGSYKGIVFAPDGRRLFMSCIHGTIEVFAVSENGELGQQSAIELPAVRAENALPVGLTIATATSDAKENPSLWAALNLNNTLAEINLTDGSLVREIPVGNAPFDVVMVEAKVYVSNWAGRHPGDDDTTGPAGKGTPVQVDPRRHIASDGSVSVVDLKAGREVKQIVVGLHPSGLAATKDGRYVCVANANSDTVSVIDVASDIVVETIDTRPDKQLLFGSTPNDLVLSDDGTTLYVSNGTNNCVAVFAFNPPQSQLVGCLPTGWYPAGIVLDEQRKALYVANIKGVGSRNLDWQGNAPAREVVSSFNSHDYLGTVSLTPLPSDDQLRAFTRIVLDNNRLTESIDAMAPPRKNVAPRAVPARHGEPSLFDHVLYIIKENRTYDQVFGDVERGEGDPSLCIFGREVTPNCHKLVEEFVLLDNFYCCGTLSADGHQWTNEAYVTDYLEKAYGGWPRSYPYEGGDAMAYAPSGFLWDNALANKKSLRVYGEFVKATIRWRDSNREGQPNFLECYRDFVEGNNEIEVKASAAIKTIEPYICPTAIGFPSVVPDIHRAEQFIHELKKFEQGDHLPNLMVMLLPNDHTAGTRPGMPTPEAAVADNDLALGRVIEAVSRSKFWPKTCIFVVQDDPQSGFDHIDGHRTVAMVVSPYTRRKVVDSTNYNQTSMIRTMELILGLPPMNQFDASATAMTSCFVDQPDFTPYEAVPNVIPLNQMNPEVNSIKDRRQRHWALASLELPLDDVDEADDETLNRILWHAVRGRDDTFPAWAVVAETKETD